MRERNAKLRGDERGGDGRIHIADDKEKIGPSRHEDRLEFQHHLRRLLRAASRTDLQIDIGIGDAQLFEEDRVHRHVVMLAGVYQPRREAVRGRESRA